MKKVFAAVVSLLVTLPAVPGEGRIPIWQPITIGPGQEGGYVLTRDISAVGGSPAIEILPGTSAVEIDLNGFTIYGAPTFGITAQNVGSMTIRNGMIWGCSAAIAVLQCKEVVIEDVVIKGTAANGIDLHDVENVAIRRNIIKLGGDTGIFIDSFGGNPVEGIIEGNQILEYGSGIEVRHAQSLGLIKNRINDVSLGNGIYIRLGSACSVVGNTVVNSQGDGIRLRDTWYTLILDNVATGLGSGLVVSNGRYNQIDRNNFSGNGLAGIWFDPGSTENTYGRNTLKGNTSLPGPCVFTPPSCAAPDLCVDALGNSSFGDNMGPGPGC